MLRDTVSSYLLHAIVPYSLHGLTESPGVIVLQQMSPLTTDERIILKQSTCQVLLLLVLQMLVGLCG